MKNIYHYILFTTLCTGAALTACQQEDADLSSGTAPGKKELTLSAASVSDRVEAGSRAHGNTFFTNGKEIKLEITLSTSGATVQGYTYTYKDGTFKGKDKANTYYFQMNDTYIKTLVARWPAERKEEDTAIDANGEPNANFPTDQRELEDYRKADWLTASYDGSGTNAQEGIMPTDAPVPLHFIRNNARLEFEIQGQNAYGQSITSLILELQLATEGSTTKATETKSYAFWAYCNKETGHAEVIVPGGSKLTCGADYMIGRIAVAGKKEYTGTVIMPKALDIELKANTSYLITLTPRGDNLVANIHIGGFGQDEEGIGIPFQLPTEGDNDVYGISNANQLMTLSYILREYKVGTETDKEKGFDESVSAINWKEQKYKLLNNITIPEKCTWKPVTKETELPEANFDSNDCTITDSEGNLLSFFKD